MKPLTIVLTSLLSSAFFVVVANADESPPPEADINLCVEMRERIFECKDAFADAFVAHHNPDAASRAAMRAQALAEIVADGSGPLAPRRQACADTVRKAGVLPADKRDGMKRGLAACVAKPNCQARAGCLMPVIRSLIGKGKTAKR